MIEFEQFIDDKTYKKAIFSHYFSYKYTYINPIIGGIIFLAILLFSLMIGEFRKPPIILGLLGLYLLIRPYLYVQNVFKSLKSKDLGANITQVKFTDQEQIIVNIGGNSSTVNLKDLYAFYNKEKFLFLYVARNQYFLIDKNKLTKDELNDVISILKRIKITEK